MQIYDGQDLSTIVNSKVLCSLYTSFGLFWCTRLDPHQLSAHDSCVAMSLKLVPYFAEGGPCSLYHGSGRKLYRIPPVWKWYLNVCATSANETCQVSHMGSIRRILCQTREWTGHATSRRGSGGDRLGGDIHWGGGSPKSLDKHPKY